MKLKLAAVLLLLLLFPALAGPGVSISPSLGTFTFGRDGGTLQLTVFNPGDEEGAYSFSMEQGSEFATLVKGQEKLMPGTYSILNIKIKPLPTTEYEKAYRLRVSASVTSGQTISAVSKLDIIFSAQAASGIEYVSDPTGASRPTGGTDWSRLVPILLALVVLAVLAGIYIKVKSSREEEIVVPRPYGWKGK